MWKHLGNEDGNGFGYCEYWHFEDPAHPEHPSEIPETMDYDCLLYTSPSPRDED